MPTQQTPRAVDDALRVLANPAAYRASLIHMAQLVALSAHNATVSQRHLQGGAA